MSEKDLFNRCSSYIKPGCLAWKWRGRSRNLVVRCLLNNNCLPKQMHEELFRSTRRAISKAEKTLSWSGPRRSYVSKVSLCYPCWIVVSEKEEEDGEKTSGSKSKRKKNYKPTVCKSCLNFATLSLIKWSQGILIVYQTQQISSMLKLKCQTFFC